MSAILKWLLATLVVAAVVHIALVFAVPRYIMYRTMTGIARNAGGFNVMTHGKRPTSASRGVVRPSPDLLYSSCIFDLRAAGGAVHVHASGMPKTYWSVSLFDAATNNFYVVNDRKAGSDGVDFLIVAPRHSAGGTKLPVVVAPTNRGIVLFRTLIDDDKRLAEIDAARRHAACEAFAL